MELKLVRTMTISELKKQFSQYFPYLKLELFHQAHGRKKGSVAQQKIGDHVCLSNLLNLKKEGVFSFNDTIPAGDFEQQFQAEYGLPVQVYRRSGAMWVQTTDTDNLSLEKQNKMGEVAGKSMTFNLNSLFL